MNSPGYGILSVAHIKRAYSCANRTMSSRQGTGSKSPRTRGRKNWHSSFQERFSWFARTLCWIPIVSWESRWMRSCCLQSHYFTIFRTRLNISEEPSRQSGSSRSTPMGSPYRNWLRIMTIANSSPSTNKTDRSASTMPWSVRDMASALNPSLESKRNSNLTPKSKTFHSDMT